MGRFTKCALGGWFSIHSKPGIKKFAEFSKKGLLFARRYDIIIKLIAAQTEYGRLAQLVEHLLDVQEVTGSSPVPSTRGKEPSTSVGGSFCFAGALRDGVVYSA